MINVVLIIPTKRQHASIATVSMISISCEFEKVYNPEQNVSVECSLTTFPQYNAIHYQLVAAKL